MGIENVSSRPVTDDPHRMGGTTPAPKNNGKRRQSAKEIERLNRLHGRLMNWYLQERDKQAENRYQMAIDEDFYDGLQWSDEDAQELMARGQAPLVFNQVKPTINWMLGTERRTRVDGKVLPREESDDEAAQVKTKLLKYLSDVNRTPFVRSAAWKSCVTAGLGWMEDYITRDPTKELLATRYESWRAIYYDSNATEMDLSDARYLFRYRWTDLDVAIALCPEKRAILEAAAVDNEALVNDEDDVYYLGSRVNTTSGDFASTRRNTANMFGVVNNGRERVKLVEAWYRMPVSCKVCRSADQQYNHFDGELYDPENEEMRGAFEDGYISVAATVRMEMRVALMTESHVLFDGKSPYKHDRFPFTPMWCYRRHRDNLPYGVIRDIRDAQEDYNKRASKALFILSTVRVIMDEGAYEDVEELRREISRPDAILTPKKGTRFEIDQDKALADQHIKLMMFDGQMIRDVGGVTDQNLGKDERGLSGQAIGKLQDQGSIVTAALFDNMRLAIQLQSEIQLSLTEQYYTAPKVVRIVGEKKPIEWLKINQYDEGAAKFINDITKSKADFIVGEQDFKASIRQAMFESMMDLISKLPPDVGLSLLDMVVDFADVPNKDELVKRIRKINGQTDPERKPTPEEEAQMQAADQEKAEAAQLQKEMAQAELAKTQAQAKEILSKAKKSEADIQKIVAQAVEIGTKAAYQALQGAGILAASPGAAPTADSILAGAGYVDRGGQDPNIPQPAGTPPISADMGGAPPLPVDEQEFMEPEQGAMPPPPELQQADGADAGIETPSINDGHQPLM